MNPNHKKITKRLCTGDTMALCTKSTDMRKTSLNKRGRPSLPKRKRGRPSLQQQNCERPSQSLRNIVGCRISHEWKEGNEPVTRWKAIVLDQLPTNPSLYLVKYDGIDCVYGLELHSDKRILKLKILPNKMTFPQVRDTRLASAIVGRAVEHKFEGKDGSKDEWKGVVLAQVPIMETWFYITYENDPVLYMYQLLDDYIDGNLRILPGSPSAETKSEAGSDTLTGKCVQYIKSDGTKQTGKVIHQILVKPSVYFIKFDDENHIYVYDLVKKTC